MRSRWRALVHEGGTTAAERAETYPCDGQLAAPDLVLFRAVDVDAPPSVVYRWLCQLRAAPYSYDWIDNRGRRSPRRLTPGLERLEVGQRVMTIFRLVDFAWGEHLTLAGGDGPFGRVVVSYVVRPRGSGARIVVKLAVAAPTGIHGVAVRRLLPFGDWVMMRRQLGNLKALAEASAREASAA